MELYVVEDYYSGDDEIVDYRLFMSSGGALEDAGNRAELEWREMCTWRDKILDPKVEPGIKTIGGEILEGDGVLLRLEVTGWDGATVLMMIIRKVEAKE